jgi:hypothetical protein
VFAPAAKNITSANMSHTPGTGVYCFQDLPFSEQSAISGPDCPSSFTKRTTRVLTFDISDNGPRDRSFII